MTEYKKLEDMTEKLDDILNWLSNSPMDNEDYNTIHKIFDKYLEIENKGNLIESEE